VTSVDASVGGLRVTLGWSVSRKPTDDDVFQSDGISIAVTGSTGSQRPSLADQLQVMPEVQRHFRLHMTRAEP
jgi:hypothetical protein